MLGCRGPSVHRVARSTSITSLITCFLGFQLYSLALLVHCRSAPEMTLPPNKEGKLPQPVSFNYRPTNLCEEQGKRQKEANRLMSSSALIKWTGWPDNPQEAESLTARGEEQISWLNNFLLYSSPAHKEGGPRPWLMHSEAWRKCLCDSPAELSPNEWSVFINLEPLSCQKERRVLEGGGQESICIQQAYSFTGTYVCSSPLPLPRVQASLP